MQISKILKYNMMKPVKRPALFNYSCKSSEKFLILAGLNRNSTAMKIKTIFWILLASIAMLSIPSCDKITKDGDELVAEGFRFILREDKVDLKTADIRIKHNGSADLMWVYMYTDDLLSDADELIGERVNIEYNFTAQIVAHVGSNKSIHLKGLDEKRYYRLIVKAINKAGQLYGKAESLVFKTRRNPDEWIENENWSVERLQRSEGTKDQVRVEYENYQCSSNDSERYIVLTLAKHEFDAYEQNPDHKDKIRTIFEDYHADFLKQRDYAKSIFKGNCLYKEERLRSGDYYFFMIGLDEENELSGSYRKVALTIEQEEALPEYTQWTGTWQISFPNSDVAPWNVVIVALDNNMWYQSVGWEPTRLYENELILPLNLYYDKFTNEVYLVTQDVAFGDDGTIIRYCGAFRYGTGNYLIDYDNVRLAKFVLTNSTATEAEIQALPINLEGIGDITFSYGLYYLTLPSTASVAASLAIPSFPWEMEKVE